MHNIVPGGKISDDAAILLKVFLERKAEELTIQASRIHERENLMRDQLGEKHGDFVEREKIPKTRGREE
jgi:hypothetical protein